MYNTIILWFELRICISNFSSDDIFTAIIQVPLSPTECPHPPVIIFNIREIKICFDPLFCKWLLYTPTITLHKAELTAGIYKYFIKNVNLCVI